jgi:dual specificity protein kinase YAK1
MEQSWQQNLEMSTSQQSRYSHNGAQQHTRNYSGSNLPQQTTGGFSYESYQTPTVPSHPQSSTASAASTPHLKHEYTGDGDVAMEDADPYNRMKYPSRPSHSQRTSSQYLPQEDSTASKRYSPMKTLSPSSSYAASPQQPNHTAYNTYAPHAGSARQSPNRSSAHNPSSSQSYYQSPGKQQ